MKHILITGCGFLGEHLLQNKNYSFAIVDKNEIGVETSFHKYKIDLANINDVEKIIQTEAPDYVIHTAANKYIDKCEQDILTSIDDNIVATSNLVKLKHKYGYGLVFISTDKAVEPESIYGYEKMLCERLVVQNNGVIIRLVNLMGSTGSVLPIWNKLISEKKPIVVRGKDTTRWMMSVEEACRIIFDSLDSKGEIIVPKEIQNVNIYDLAKTLTNNIILEDSVKAFEKSSEKLYWENEKIQYK